jgi:GntR family transcriptional regulator
MFIRIEPSSVTPIYRQIMDQIKYQIAMGILRPGDKLPSVRQLAEELAVNYNTTLKVYNELCRENVLRVERGKGTLVTDQVQTLSLSQRKKTLAPMLREAAVQAMHLDISLDQAQQLFAQEYKVIEAQKNRSEPS